MKLLIFNLLFCAAALALPAPDNNQQLLRQYLRAHNVSITKEMDDVIDMNVVELLNYYGYECEERKVVTEDGYELKGHYIKSKVANSTKTVIFTHGILSTVYDWISMGKDKSFACMCADKGFNSYLISPRGDPLTIGHKNIPIDSEKYWNFSFDQIGKYDLPAFIDDAMKISGEKGEIYYVGHSQGTSAFFAMTATRPEYAKQIKMAITLAPVAYMESMTNFLLKALALFSGVLEDIMKFFGEQYFRDDGPAMALARTVCESQHSSLQMMCIAPMWAVCGWSQNEVDANKIAVALAHPGTFSLRGAMHYAQLINSGGFRMYDYGKSGNLQEYGQATAPDYKIQMPGPVVLVYSDVDPLSAPMDVFRMKMAIGANAVLMKTNYAHLDYLFGKPCPQLYEELIKKMEGL